MYSQEQGLLFTSCFIQIEVKNEKIASNIKNQEKLDMNKDEIAMFPS